MHKNNRMKKSSLLNVCKTLAVCAFLTAAASPLCAADASSTPKVATIDLKKVFDGYFKTKQADSQLKERATDSEKVLKGMLDDYQKSNEDYRKLVDSANDQSLSAE